MTLCGDPHGGPALASWRGQHLLSPMALVAEQRHLRILIPRSGMFWLLLPSRERWVFSPTGVAWEPEAAGRKSARVELACVRSQVYPGHSPG